MNVACFRNELEEASEKIASIDTITLLHRTCQQGPQKSGWLEISTPPLPNIFFKKKYAMKSVCQVHQNEARLFVEFIKPRDLT